MTDALSFLYHSSNKKILFLFNYFDVTRCWKKRQWTVAIYGSVIDRCQVFFSSTSQLGVCSLPPFPCCSRSHHFFQIVSVRATFVTYSPMLHDLFFGEIRLEGSTFSTHAHTRFCRNLYASDFINDSKNIPSPGQIWNSVRERPFSKDDIRISLPEIDTSPFSFLPLPLYPNHSSWLSARKLLPRTISQFNWYELDFCTSSSSLFRHFFIFSPRLPFTRLFVRGISHTRHSPFSQLLYHCPNIFLSRFYNEERKFDRFIVFRQVDARCSKNN